MDFEKEILKRLRVAFHLLQAWSHENDLELNNTNTDLNKIINNVVKIK